MTEKISSIAALNRNRAIGKDNALLWHIPDDLRRFKELTMGHPCIMGRKTFDSIIATLGKPLPNRTSIVLTRGTLPEYENVIPASSVEDALAKADSLGSNEVFICGGAHIYDAFLPHTDALYLTFVDDDTEGDTHFPEYATDFAETSRSDLHEHAGIRYQFVHLERTRT
jgi:dihydrofolate reductase